MPGNEPVHFRDRKRGRPPGSRTAVRWNDGTTLELIKTTTKSLIEAGMTRPPIRAVLYRLLSSPGWAKSHYKTLTEKLGEWRDAGLFEYGVFSDDSGGRSRPYTPKEIAEQVRAWKKKEPAHLPADGYLRALLVEHEALVDQIQEWCDGHALVVSSAGQIRRENLWTAVSEWKSMADELGAKGIIVYALMDRDDGGDKIYEAHRRWFEKVAGLELRFYGLTDTQLEDAALATDEDWQIDGVIGLDPAGWRTQVRDLLLGD